MHLLSCEDNFTTEFIFQSQNLFIINNVCDNYVIINMAEFFLVNMNGNGISLAILVIIISGILLKILNLVLSRFVVSDMLFTKAYFKINETIMAFIFSMLILLMTVIIPRKASFGVEQVRSASSLFFILATCLVLPLTFFNNLRHKKGLIFPNKI